MSDLLLPGSIESRRIGCICPRFAEPAPPLTVNVSIDPGCKVHEDIFLLDRKIPMSAEEFEVVLKETLSENRAALDGISVTCLSQELCKILSITERA